MGSNKKAIERRQKKAAQRRVVRVRTKQQRSLVNDPNELHVPGMKSCDEFYNLALNTVRDTIKVSAYAHQVLCAHKIKVESMTDSNPEVAKLLIQHLTTTDGIAQKLDTGVSQILVQFGKIEDTKTHFDRMQLTVEVMPKVRRYYEIREALRVTTLKLVDLAIKFTQGELSLEDLNTLIIPDIDVQSSDEQSMADALKLISEMMDIVKADNTVGMDDVKAAFDELVADVDDSSESAEPEVIEVEDDESIVHNEPAEASTDAPEVKSAGTPVESTPDPVPAETAEVVCPIIAQSAADAVNCVMVDDTPTSPAP